MGTSAIIYLIFPDKSTRCISTGYDGNHEELGTDLRDFLVELDEADWELLFQNLANITWVQRYQPVSPEIVKLYPEFKVQKTRPTDMGEFFEEIRYYPAQLLQRVLEGSLKHVVEEFEKDTYWTHKYEIKFETRTLGTWKGSRISGVWKQKFWNVPLYNDEESYILTEFT